MRKLLELDSKALRSGRTRGKFVDGGLWDAAIGLNPYLESDLYRSVVALSPTPTDKTGAVVVDIPIAYTKDERGSTYDLYILGLSGHLYRVTSNEVVTDLRSGTPIDTPANGIGIFQPRAAASPTLLFARSTRIGTWDLSGTYATGWNDSAYNPGTTTIHRPFHRFLDRLYYGNKQYVGQFSDDGTSTIAHEPQGLDLDGQDTVTALADDGRFLVIATARTITESYNGMNRVRVLFWNAGGSATSWDWEVSIPNETSIRAMKRVGDVVYAVGKRALYALSFGAAPQIVYTFDSDEAVAFDPSNYSHVQSIAAWGDGVIFGKLATAFARFLPNTDRIIYNPLRGMTGDIGLIIPDFLENKVYVGTRSSKLYSCGLESAGASATPIITRIIPLDRTYHVQRLEIDLPNGISGSDSITIIVQGKHGTDSVTLPTITQAVYGNVHRLSIPFRNVTTADVRLSMTLSAGGPSFSTISLWGDPASL